MKERHLHLALASGDDSVTGDELGHDTTSGLDTECQGVDINENDITEGLVAGQNTTLNSSTVSNGLIGVDRLVGLLAFEEVGHELDNTGDTSGTTDKDDFVNIGLVDLGIMQDLSTGSRVPQKRYWQSSSNRAQVMEV